MARRGKQDGRRGDFSSYSTPNPRLSYSAYSVVRAPRRLVYTDLRPIEDRRVFNPAYEARPARQFTSSRHRLVVREAAVMRRRSSLIREAKSQMGLTAFDSVPRLIGFEAPLRTLVCLRRRIRKEVLHALGRTGKGGSPRKDPRRSEYSGVVC